MNRTKGFSKMWFLVLLLVTLVAGCGGNDTVTRSSAKDIVVYSLDGATGVIDETAKTIAVIMPYNTNVTALVATATITGASVKVGSVPQTSGITANDFTTPVIYTVTASDGTTVTYTVSVTVASISAKTINGYSLNGVAGTINETAKTIAVNLPNGTAKTALVATFTTTGTGVKIGTVAQASGTTANDFTNPVAYTVHAGDSTTATYTVTVAVAATSAKAITAFSLGAVAGTIDETAKSIAVTVPNGTSVAALVATFATTGATVKVDGAVQTSGTTANNFTGPVAYRVTAADGTTATYNVTVTVAQNSSKEITAYSLAGVIGNINETAKTVMVTMPYGTDVTALVATFTTTGAGVKVGVVTQKSGTTANNFTTPLAYTVTAADSTKQATYTVTVTVAANSDKAITAYTLAGVTGIIDETAKTIAVTMPKGIAVTALVATFTTTGTGVKVGVVAQTSGTTINDFTAPQTYTVDAANSETATYTVTVTAAKGPAAVNLGTAGNFVILAKSGVSTTGTTAVVGDIGLSPSAATFVTGFGLIADSTNTFSTSSLVTGKIYAANFATPTPARMTTAVSDMETAFTDAAGRTLPDFTELGAGNISGMTLVPGLYKWGTGVLITNAGVTLSGGENDVWIFQIAQNLTVNNSAIITLSGGAQAKNIFWQVSGQATLGTAADFKGIILSQTLISLNTGTIMNGRALAQTAVTLNATAITAP